jgi:hypothetical protein
LLAGSARSRRSSGRSSRSARRLQRGGAAETEARLAISSRESRSLSGDADRRSYELERLEHRSSSRSRDAVRNDVSPRCRGSCHIWRRQHCSADGLRPSFAGEPSRASGGRNIRAKRPPPTEKTLWVRSHWSRTRGR